MSIRTSIANKIVSCILLLVSLMPIEGSSQQTYRGKIDSLFWGQSIDHKEAYDSLLLLVRKDTLLGVDFLHKIQQLEEKASKNSSEWYQAQLLLLMYMDDWDRLKADHQPRKIEKQRTRLETLAEEKDLRLLRIKLLENRADYFKSLEQNEIASVYLRELIPYAEKYQDNYLLHWYHFQLANIATLHEDENDIIFHNKEIYTISKKKPELYAWHIVNSLNNIGFTYCKKEKYDSAAYYFTKTKMEALTLKNTDWVLIANANLANIEYQKGNYLKAVEPLQKDIERSVLAGEYYTAAAEQITLCNIALKIFNEPQLTEVFQTAQRYIDSSGRYYHQAEWIPTLAKYHIYKGNNEQAVMYIDSSRKVQDSLANLYDKKSLYRVEQQEMLREKEIENKNLQLDLRDQILHRNLAIVLASVIFFLGIILFFFIRQRNIALQLEKDLSIKQKEAQVQRKQAELLRKNQRILKQRLELKKANDALNEARRAIQNFTSQIRKQHQTIIELEQSTLGTPTREKLEELKQNTILTDDQWYAFQLQFSQLYPDFLSTIKRDYPELTKTEIRYLVLKKIQLSTQEMAHLQGVSDNTVHKTASRIRKKINMDNQELEKYLG